MTTADAFSTTRLFVAPSALPQTLPSLTQPWAGGVMSFWDPVSFANTVRVGPVTYQNLPVVSPNGLTEGTVLLALAPGGYIVIGMLASAATVTVLDPIRYRVLRADISVTSSTAMVNAGPLAFELNTNTQYALDGCLFYNASTSGDINIAFDGPPNMAVKWSAWGTQNTSFTHLYFDTVAAYGDANPQQIYGWGFSAPMHPRGWFATSDTPGILQLRFAQATSNATPTILQQGSWLRIAELGAASGAQTYIKIYPATGSQTYNSAGGAQVANPAGVNGMYIGDLSSTGYGNSCHMWTFNGAQIRSDLTGATVLSAQMFLYCYRSDSHQADYPWQWSTTSTIQTTMPTNGFGGADTQNLWTPPAWAAFDITSQMSAILTQNANSVLGGPAGFYDAYSEFYGYGTPTYAPYLQITYAI